MKNTKLTVMHTFEADGTPEELSMFAGLFVAFMRQIQRDDEQKEISMSAEELFRTLREGQEKRENQKGGETE